MRRTVAKVAVGVVAGAVLVGAPTYAVASQEDSSSSHRHSSSMGEVMSDPEMRKEMKSFMSDMMSDPEHRRQMRSMMSETMKGMSMGDGSMSMRGQ